MQVKMLQELRSRMHQMKLAWKWKRAGKVDPPPHIVKQWAIRRYAKRYGARTLVETGTYMGHMVYAMRQRFDHIISIELDRNLYDSAVRQFREYHNITLLNGDSGEIIERIVRNETNRCLFWLDGHYSGEGTAKTDRDTPIREELRHISSSPIKHVILIDDARLFDGRNDYPTLDELRQDALVQFPNYHFTVADDIVRLVPRNQ